MSNPTPTPNIAVIRLRDVLIVTMLPDPDDATVAALHEGVLGEMERNPAEGLVLDISQVETLDSFFVRTISETAQMVTLMGGRTIIAGMQPTVAITAVQMGLVLPGIETSLSVDAALDKYVSHPSSNGS